MAVPVLDAAGPLSQAAAAFESLNAPQRAAVAHGREPLLVLAGAGTGKTHTLAARLARLVGDGVDPGRVLLLSFSRRSAQELVRRAGQLLAVSRGLRSTIPLAALPWAGTFHAVGARWLHEWAPAVGLPPDFTILDRSDAEDLMNLARSELGLGRGARFPLKGTCLAIYSRTVNTGRPLTDVLRDTYPWCLAVDADLRRLFQRYVEAKQAQHVLDFDDLLLYPAQALADEGLARQTAARYDHVLVDEYQDTNALQEQILRRLRPGGAGLTVVGDDAQSIYAFRGAEVRNILGFEARHGSAVRTIRLEQNYRSTTPILQAANALMAGSTQTLAKTLWSAAAGGMRPRWVTVADPAAQACWVADDVLAQRETGLPLRRQAVLFRTASHSAELEVELVRRRIPFVKYGGLKFLESAHVKDLLGLLRWAQNPLGRLAGLRSALLVPGIGPSTARRLLERIAAADDPVQALCTFEPPRAACEDWARFVDTYRRLRTPVRQWPAAFDAARAWLEPQVDRLYDQAMLRHADLAQLGHIAAGYPSRERFLAELTLDPPQASSDEAGAPHRDEDYLVLSTIHSAKGQEWSAVTVLNVVDGCMPADMAAGSVDELEEERRLLYVAMTRARHHLALVCPQRFHVTQQHRRGDRHVYAVPSRFIDDAVMSCLEPEHLAPPQAPQPVPQPDGRLDVAARVRDAWLP